MSVKFVIQGNYGSLWLS